MKKTNKVLQYISWLTILVALALLFILGYWLFYPYKPMILNEGTGTVLNKDKIVSVNEDILFKLNYCKEIPVGAEITTSFVDGVIYNTTPIISNLPVGCEEKIIQVYVPSALPSGEFNVRQVLRYKINPIRKIDVIITSEKFTVIH
jgi:hypothetical protein